MNNLRHSTNSPCQCVDRHTTRSLSTDCKPFNIKTSPATPDFTQKRILNLYKNTQHPFNPHTSHCQASTHGQTSDQIQLVTLSPSQILTHSKPSNTPKPTITPHPNPLSHLTPNPLQPSSPVFCRHAPTFNPHPSYSRLNTQNLRSNPTCDTKPKPKYSHTQNHLTPQNQP